MRHGTDAGLARVDGTRRGAAVTAEVRLSDREPKRIRWNGTAVGSAEELRSRIHALAFTPDRLAVVKGGPALRRAYFDRVVARVLPARADVPTAYAAALGQRNAALRRVAAGISEAAALEPWTAQLVALGEQLVEARARLLAMLVPVFAERAAELGLEAASLAYRPPRRRGLRSRSASRGTSSEGRPASGRISTRSRCSPPTAISGPSGRRVSSGGGPVAPPRRGGAARLPGRRPAAPPPRRRPVGARRRPAARPERPARRDGPDPGHGDGRGGASPRTRAAPRGDSRPGGGGLMERLDGSIRRALRVAGVPDAGAPRCGDACVARRGRTRHRRGRHGRSGSARDGTLHVTTVSSTWAFELGRMEEDVRASSTPRSARRRRPPSGSRPARSPPPEPPGESPPTPSPPTPDEESPRCLADLPRSTIRPSATPSVGQPRQASPLPATAASSDILKSARKTLVLQAFSRSGGLVTDTAHTRKDITVSKGLEPVRLRPGMYIGSTGLAGPPSPGLRGRRQRSRRGARGPQRLRRGALAPRPLGHGRRPRTGNPGRHDR